MGKAYMRSCSIRYRGACSRRHQKHRLNLERSLQRAFTRLQSGDLAAGNEIERFKTQIQQFDWDRVQGRGISKIVASSEKCQSGCHHFVELQTARGSTVKTPAQFLPVVENRLKTTTPSFTNRKQICPDDVTKPLNSVDTTLTIEDRVSCEGPLLEGECAAAVQQSTIEKPWEWTVYLSISIGVSGTYLEMTLLKSLINFFQLGSLSISQWTRVIRLLYKKGTAAI